MREIESIAHPHCSVTIYNYNKKYIVKLEFGMHAVEYKIPQENLDGGLPQLKQIFNEEYIDKHATIFTKMNNDFQEAFQKANV